MRLPKLTHAIALTIALSTVATANPLKPPPPGFGAQLIEIYENWSKGMIGSDLQLWRENTATYRQIGTRNLIVSQKKRWPESLFNNPITPADISELRLAKVMENGPTAQLIYYGKADFGADKEIEIPNGLLFLMFVKEKSGWKFNTSRFMSLAGAGEAAAAAAAGDFAFLDTPEFQPPGEVPPLPKLCPIPQMVGIIEIVSVGYEATVRVGDHSKHVVINNTQTGLIIGGLKRGNNIINVETRPLSIPPDAAARRGRQAPLRIHHLPTIPPPQRATKRHLLLRPHQEIRQIQSHRPRRRVARECTRINANVRKEKPLSFGWKPTPHRVKKAPFTACKIFANIRVHSRAKS